MRGELKKSDVVATTLAIQSLQQLVMDSFLEFVPWMGRPSFSWGHRIHSFVMMCYLMLFDMFLNEHV